MNSLQGAWRSFRREEQITLIVCALVLAFCSGFHYSRQRATRPLPPIFESAPRHDLTGQLKLQQHDGRGAHDILVHVAGAIRRAGVHSLPAGARVIDAVRAAGGPTPHAKIQALNLAARLQDGEKVTVPIVGQAVHPILASDSRRSLEASVPVGKRINASRVEHKLLAGSINANTATASELEALPGIGPTLALRILQQRQQHGQFHSLDDLRAVKDLGPKKLENLRAHVTF